MKTNNIPTSLLVGLESNISYRYSVSMYIKVAVYVILTAASVLTLIFADIDSRSSWFFALLSLAIIFALMSIITMFCTKKEPRLSDDNSRLICHTFQINATPSSIIDDIQNHNFKHLKSSVFDGEGGCRLNVLMSDKADVARYILYKYVPFEYQPVSEIITIDKDIAQSLIQL